MDQHPSLKMKSERRDALFAAATQEFTEFGFEQASLNRIISKVGMSKSSFYHYFPNKTGLFEQIFHQTFAPFAKIISNFEPEMLEKDTFWPVICEAFQSTGAMMEKHPQIFNVGRMFHRSLHEPSSICEGMMEVPIAFTTRLIEHGKVIGAIRNDLPTSLLRESVLALGMAVDRWAVEYTEGYSVAEFSAFNTKVLSMFMSILTPQP